MRYPRYLGFACSVLIPMANVASASMVVADVALPNHLAVLIGVECNEVAGLRRDEQNSPAVG